MAKVVKVEYLYLDLKSCDRCIGTDGVLDEVMTVLAPVLKIAGYEVEYNKVEMITEELASEYSFVSSPTIRVNGKDICQSVSENNCGCCSEISGTDVDCRVFEFEGLKYEVPPKEMIASSILQVVFGCSGASASDDNYTLPGNLKVFYKGKRNKKER